MYQAFYGLKEKPFSIQPDPDYLYWGRAHSMAFAMLEYGIMNRAGFTVITGEIGCGKTTLIRHLLNKLDDNVTVGLVSNTQENNGELLQWVLMAFGQPFEDKAHVALYDQLHKFLIDEYGNGRRTILIVDEAQNLGPKSLEELRMLSNINADKDQLLQLVLVGQPQLKDLLQSPELAQFAQRIASDFHLRTLSKDEVEDYIHHRIKIAGCDRQVFSGAACKKVFDASRGVPRLINIICDTSLVYGFSGGMAEITGKIVEDVVRDKSEYGIFSFNGPRPVENGATGREPKKFEVSDGTDSPALIIRDKELAKYIFSKVIDSAK